MLETLAAHLDSIAALAPTWGFAFVFFFMAVESSFIPFPSEIVMIPAGFLAFRGQLSTGAPWPDVTLAFFAGMAGCIVGAYVNYWIGLKLGRPILHRYGKYFFIKEQALDRAEELFRKYGDITTFVCRLIPVIRQLISIPAGMSKMGFGRFTLFTALGAGLWNAILLAVGAWFGHSTADLTYLELVTKGKALVTDHYGWIAAGLAAVIVLYILVHRLALGQKKA